MTNASDATTLRSMLFVPALQDRFVQKAAQSEADAIILDLEDSIPLADKAQARERIAQGSAFLAEHGKRVFVRINSSPDEAIPLDVAAAVAVSVEGILLPKAETFEQTIRAAELAAHLGKDRQSKLGIIPIIESPLGLVNIAGVAQSHETIVGLAFGSEDFAFEMDGGPPEPENMAYPAHQVAITAKAFGLAALGLPGSIAIVDDMPTFNSLAAKAKKIGMTGVLCIHPKQVAEAHAVFTPSQTEVDHALVVKDVYEEAARQGVGAVRHEGKMVDLPHYRKALRVLQAARTLA